MAKIDKMEKFLKEEKPKKQKDLEVGFDIGSFESEEDTDTLGFRSELEPIGKNKEKALEKEIQVTTPGLKKSIKKFEDFNISISVDEVEPEEDFLDVECCSGCQCDPCECDSESCCSGCDCDPCECSSGEDAEKVIGFEDFLKTIM